MSSPQSGRVAAIVDSWFDTLTVLSLFFTWFAGVVLAPTWYEKLFCILTILPGWYYFVHKVLQVIGWI